jgi:hypothetical protein
MNTLDFEAIARDVLLALQSHQLQPDNFGVSITLPRVAFDTLFEQHPNLVNGRMVGINVTVNGIQASVQVLRRREIAPDMVMHPPE